MKNNPKIEIWVVEQHDNDCSDDNFLLEYYSNREAAWQRAKDLSKGGYWCGLDTVELPDEDRIVIMDEDHEDEQGSIDITLLKVHDAPQTGSGRR